MGPQLRRVDERDRQRRIRENDLLLTSLGIAPTTPKRPFGSSTPRLLPQSQPTAKRKGGHKTVYDRSGHVISGPNIGEFHHVACVEMPSDRGLRRRIAEEEYQDCTQWQEGEARRWRFGWGRGGHLAKDEPEETGGVGESFRWRKWKGLEKELRKEMRKRGELIEFDSRPEQQEQRKILPGVSAYSVRSFIP